MADRSIHYEAAFEAYLRDRKIPYVAVDEAKKALFSAASLKSFDFVVYSQKGTNLLIDIKGRSAVKKSTRECWVTESDVDDLIQWEQVFGTGFKALLAFVHWIDPPMVVEPGMYEFRERWYTMSGVRLSEYRDHMRRRSEKWKTVSLSAEDYKQLARPLDSWL